MYRIPPANSFSHAHNSHRVGPSATPQTNGPSFSYGNPGPKQAGLLHTGFDDGTHPGSGGSTANGTINNHLALLYSSTQEADQNLQPDALTFVASGRGLQSMLTSQHEIVTLTNLNKRMMTPEYRKVFGVMNSANASGHDSQSGVAEAFKFYGVQIANSEQWSAKYHERVQTFHVGQRAMTPNVWEAIREEGGSTGGMGALRKGDHLYLLWVRKCHVPALDKIFYRRIAAPSAKFGYEISAGIGREKAKRLVKEQASAAAKVNTMEATLNSSSSSSSISISDEGDEEKEDTTAEEEEPVAVEDVNMKPLNPPLFPRRRGGDKQDQQHYWQIEPYVSVNRQPPPVHLYSGPGWVGAYIFVGGCTDIIGNTSREMEHGCGARDILHPPDDTGKESAAYIRLNKVEIQLGWCI